ncbi:hypothetical protein [Mesorhizobium shangrilense]|uniref:Uncharacterized protein n=1 Tax=Mesorhizobium shangrilense TaxID=460060 RepID=A0ABV2DNZ5_9HYPH
MRADKGNLQKLQGFDRFAVMTLVLISSLYVILVTVIEFGEDFGFYWP